jgi:hypothetical protein
MFLELRRAGVPFGVPLQVKGNTVGTSTSSAALLGTGDVGERSNFFCAGLLWQWYYDGTGNGLGYRTSADGKTWSSITYVSPTSASSPSGWDIYFDGTYVHYAAIKAASQPIYYRRGVPLSNGAVSWSAAEQTVVSGGSYICVCVCADTFGYPLVSYVNAANSYAYVIKSSTIDGTWSTKSGYPKQSHAQTPYKTLLLQLTQGKILLLYIPSTAGDGGLDDEVLVNDALTGWQIVTQTAPNYSGSWSAVAVGDDVHLVSNEFNLGVYYVAYYKLTYATGSWSSVLAVVTGLPAIAFSPKISCLGGADLAVFYANSDNYVYYVRKMGNTWDAKPSKLVNETSEVLSVYSEISASEKTYAGRTLLSWLGKSGSPYDIRFIQVALI